MAIGIPILAPPRSPTSSVLLESSAHGRRTTINSISNNTAATGSQSAQTSFRTISNANRPARRVPVVIAMDNSDSEDDSSEDEDCSNEGDSGYGESLLMFFSDNASRKRASQDTSDESSSTRKKERLSR